MLERRVSAEKEESITATDFVMGRPSSWFLWHRQIFQPGMRVLDLACGSGKHALAAATSGCNVTAIDLDSERLKEAQEYAASQSIDIEWLREDLKVYSPPADSFDVVMVFNYLDRSRIERWIGAVKKNGFLMYETFLGSQRDQEWGPTSPDHLLEPWELHGLANPLEVVHYREVLEMRGEKLAAVASLLAMRTE